MAANTNLPVFPLHKPQQLKNNVLQTHEEEWKYLALSESPI